MCFVVYSSLAPCIIIYSQALKNEIDSLKQGPSSSAITSVAAVKGSKEEIAAKLIAYQSFMAKYIVEAQEEKLRAVKAAEAAMAKKFEGNLLSAAAPAAPVLASAASSPETKLYMDRNAKVSAAAAAGKSRWGQKEVERVSRTNNVGAAAIAPEEVNGSAVVKPSVASPAVVVPPEVKAADHGLRSDGSVGGLTLAERVALGASANGAAAPPMLSKQGVLYHQRNAMVAASAKAGKSRWGDMEVQKAVKLASAAPAAVAAAPEIEAADHGLRADGSVGGPSLAERVNLGAQLLGR